MKTWTVKTIIGPDHQVTFKVPIEVPVGPVEMVLVVQPSSEERASLKDRGWTEAQAMETRERLKSFDADWNAPGMDAYDAL